jgi:hypothetical protein
MDVSVIVVTYNSREVVRDCLASIQDHACCLEYEVIVVDNASSDGSAELVAQEFPTACLIRNRRNVGFAAAANQGAQLAHGTYLHFVNPDAFFINDALPYFFDFLQNPANSRVGVVGAYIEDRKGNLIHSAGGFPFPISYLIARFRAVVRKILPIRRLRKPRVNLHNRQPTSTVDYVTGADMFCRKDVFFGFGGFDERFFVYCEESDLQWRIGLAGFKRVLIDGPRIGHVGGHSIKCTNAQRIHLETSVQKYMSKNFGRFAGSCFTFAFSVSIILEFVIDLLRWEYTPGENLQFLSAIRRAGGDSLLGPKL